MRHLLLRCCALPCLVGLAPLAAAQETGFFELHFDAAAFAGDQFQGEVFIAFSEEGEPRRDMHRWFGAPPVMRLDLPQAKQGAIVKVSLADAIATAPLKWTVDLDKTWKVQAIARTSLTGREAGMGEGDIYSEISDVHYVTGSEGVVALHLDQVASKKPFAETERVRLFDFVSPALSKFHGVDYTMHAGVLLPRNYDPEQTYPVLYSVTGFGGSHHGIGRWEQRIAEGSPLDDCIIVVPDANNRYGHSVFCDSESIGPWGQALVHELIPALEEEYGGAGPEQRYVTGVSSGGWSSLWLQVTYPEEFEGCWSHVPDPIDFHDFQSINIYEPLEDGSSRNMYVDEAGEERGVARRDGEVLLTYRKFAQREHVLNPGGQIRSFDGTFGAPLPDGTPRRMFDIETGEIDHEAARAWRKFDISNMLLTRWDELKPALKGKLNIFAGEVDTFYLEGAVIRFRSLALEAGMLDDMVVEIVPGMAHAQHKAGFDDMVETIAEDMLEVAQ
ncbi:MAG: hypothetical protein ACI9F9_001763 [Candidatus Paceibacteria bacterium]|jgi:hypothetical protein